MRVLWGSRVSLRLSSVLRGFRERVWFRFSFVGRVLVKESKRKTPRTDNLGNPMANTLQSRVELRVGVVLVSSKKTGPARGSPQVRNVEEGVLLGLLRALGFRRMDDTVPSHRNWMGIAVMGGAQASSGEWPSEDLSYQLSMVRPRPTLAFTGHGGLGFDSGEGA